jgi:hypothetical protein
MRQKHETKPKQEDLKLIAKTLTIKLKTERK